MDVIDDQGRAAAALEIKKAMRRGPSGNLLQKHAKIERTRIRKTDYSDTVRRLADQVLAGMAKCGIEPVPPLKALGRGRYNGIGDCSTATIRKIHAGGPALLTPDSEWLRKISLPAQSANSRYDGVTADDGATLGAQRQAAPGAKPTRLGPPHSDSIKPRNALPTDNEDPTVKVLKQIFSKAPQRGL